jgi:hypothetical protein
MSNLSNHAETLALTWLMTAGSATRPTSWYVALHTGDPGETGASSEVSGTGYARQSAAFDAPASGATANTADLTFTAGGAWGTVTHASIWDAVSGGNCLWQGTCTNKAITSGDVYKFLAGALDLALA